MSTIRIQQTHTSQEAVARDIERAVPVTSERTPAPAVTSSDLLRAASAMGALLLALIPVHWLTQPVPWLLLVWEALVTLATGALVFQLSRHYRAREIEAADLRVEQREGRERVGMLRDRLGRARLLLRHVGKARKTGSIRQEQQLSAATFELLGDSNYATVYSRIARLACRTFGDACRVDLWDSEARQVERYWTSAREHALDVEAFLKQLPALDQLPQVRQVMRNKRVTVIEPVAGLNWPRLKPSLHTSTRMPAALLIVPVEIGGVVRVTLTICRSLDGRDYDDATVARAEDFARHAAIVITHLFRLEHLMAARYRAEDAEQAKTEVLAAFSHDMRTPLQAVNGYTQLLLEQLAGPLNAKQREYLLRIQQAQERVTGFVDRVLALARLDNQQSTVDNRPVELSALTRDVAALFTLDCQRKALRIEMPCSDDRMILRTDAEKLSRVLQNLISNAVKYTAAGGAINVSWRELGNRIEVVVADNGRGVPKQELDAIFQPFYQVDPQSEGSGLGLAISRSLAHDMGGDLRVVSELGRGSTFTLHLPRAIAIHTSIDPVMLEPLVLPVLASRQSA